MEKEDLLGPIRKISSRHRKRSHSGTDKQFLADVAIAKSDKKICATEVIEELKGLHQDDFHTLNESDLALAEIDIETSSEGLSCIQKESHISHNIKKMPSSHPPLKTVSDNILQIETQRTYILDQITSQQINENMELCSAEVDLFEDFEIEESENSSERLIHDCCSNQKVCCGTEKVLTLNYLTVPVNENNSVIDLELTTTNNTTENTMETKTEIASHSDYLSEYFFTSSTRSNATLREKSPVTNETNCSHTTDPLQRPITSKVAIRSETQGFKNIPSNNEEDHYFLKSEKTNITPVGNNGDKRLKENTSLKERLKQRLKENAGKVAPKQDLEGDMKKEAMQQAQLDASQIRKEGTKVDIGPFYGLPAKVQLLFENKRSIKKLYDWQNECLQLKAVKEHRNLIYSLPTSGGKTLVAEVLIMRELLCYEKDTLLILPFVSIVQEKVRNISEFAVELGFIVEEYAGSKGRFPPTKRQRKKSLYIATIEKAHSLVNSLIETDRMASLGLVVVDELHMIGEGGSRGATLEATLMKITTANSDTQIIGMSATLNNIKDLQDFLAAEVYYNDFRPVILEEYVKVEDNLFKVNQKALDQDSKLEHERFLTYPYNKELHREDPDLLLGLVTEVIPEKSCLVFCPTKKNCENVAQLLSQLICKHRRDLVNVNRDKRKQLLQELLRDGDGKICPVLEYTVHFGIAYHHSGLTMDERFLIEEAYSNGVLCLLTCTSTLAAGVNLPAKRVILRSPYIGNSFIKFSQYKQMTGRAGRAGIDTSGESIVIVNSKDKIKVKDLLGGPHDYCHSSLGYDGGKGVRCLLLSVIGLKIVSTTDAAFEFLQKSLLHIQAGCLGADIATLTREALQYLIDEELVVQTRATDDETPEEKRFLQVTPLGNATFKGSIDHTYSRQLYRDLNKAKESLNLSTYLHLLYLVTPYDMAGLVVPDWNVYFDQYCKLTEIELKTAGAIGVHENYLGLRAAGHKPRTKVCELTIQRFYLSLMLWDLWNQKSVWEVANRFSQTRGFIQNLLTQASSFASCIFHFCKELEEFWAYQQLLEHFIKKLTYCVSIELLPLMEIPGVKLARAKMLHAAGYKSISVLASAEVSNLVHSVEHLSKRTAQQIIAAAKNMIEEKKAALLEEVESLVSLPGNLSAT